MDELMINPRRSGFGLAMWSGWMAAFLFCFMMLTSFGPIRKRFYEFFR
jgi:hypothetical protein